MKGKNWAVYASSDGSVMIHYAAFRVRMPPEIARRLAAALLVAAEVRGGS